MSTPAQFGDPGYTPEQYQAAAASVQAPPVAVGPDPAELAAKAAQASATETDVAALLKAQQEQINALIAQMRTLKAGQVPAGQHQVVADAAAVRDLVAQHYAGHPKSADLTRLADDVYDAAGNAVTSGNPGPFRGVVTKLERALNRWHPGPGDNHYHRLALNMVKDSLPEGADTITEAQPTDAPAVGSSQPPVRVVAGSVTG